MSNTISIRLAIILALVTCGMIFIANQMSLFRSGEVAPALELVAIAIIGIYTIFIATRIRQSDVQAVVPSRVVEALDSLAEGLLILDENQTILLANQAFSTAVGLSADQLVGKRAGALSWDVETTSDANDFPWNRATESGKRQIEQLLHFCHRDGTGRVFAINCSPIAGDGSKSRGALATFRDVTQIEAHRAEMNSRIRHLEILAAHDPLTECLNRRSLVPKMQAIWDLSIESSQPVACLMIDIDHFKQINDAYGHKVGDMVLREVAATIRQSARNALVCRYGGEEFCVVLPDTPIELATELAEQTRQQVAAIPFEAAEELSTTISIGVSESRYSAENPQDLITQADQCLYLAKQQGRNRVVIMSASVVQILQPEQPAEEHN